MRSFPGGRRRRSAIASLILVAGALAACSTSTREPVIRTVEVKVPTPVSCVPRGLKPAPDYPDTDRALKAAPGAAERYQLVQAGRLLRMQRQAETEPVIEGCRDKP